MHPSRAGSRSRSPRRQRQEVADHNDSRQLAVSHARTLWASLGQSVQQQIEGVTRLEDFTALNSIPHVTAGPATGPVQNIVIAISWLLKSGPGATKAQVEWKYAAARVGTPARLLTSQVHLTLREPVISPTSARFFGRAGPTPTANLRLLEDFQHGGGDPGALLDAVFASRTSAAHADGTHTTYRSHLNMIDWACRVINSDPLPATLSTIHRISVIVNDATTLRGWLAAWKLAHDCVGWPWKGDLDPRLRAARLGTMRLMPPKLEERRARMAHTVMLVKWALRRNERRWKLWGGIAAMSYVFGFRIPSEVLRQWKTQAAGGASFRIVKGDGGETIVKYGPYVRKGRFHHGFSSRGCLCKEQRILCPHLWTEAFDELLIQSAEGITLKEFTAMLREAVSASLPVSSQGRLNDWTSHAFRRGGAVDILQSKGVQAMLQHGEWAAEASAHSYASLDEVDTQKLKTVCLSWPDLSDDDL